MTRNQHYYRSQIIFNADTGLYTCYLIDGPQGDIYLGSVDNMVTMDILRKECINHRRNLVRLYEKGLIEYNEIVQRTEDYAEDIIRTYYKLKEEYSSEQEEEQEE